MRDLNSSCKLAVQPSVAAWPALFLLAGLFAIATPLRAQNAPTVTTLSPVSATNGVTLYATVNPNGSDTTVYFNWGTNNLNNSTTNMDIGSGVTPLNVSSLLTGLAPATQYFYEVVASNYHGRSFGADVFFPSPPFTSAPIQTWTSVAASADGTKLAAGGMLYTSTNAGTTWTHPTTPFGQIQAVASSADGAKLLVAVPPASLYVSTNFGAGWTQSTNSFSGAFSSVASSADGAKLVAVSGFGNPQGGISTYGGIYTSTNSGLNWTRHTNGLPTFASYNYVASSADGSKLAVTGSGSIYYTSTNSGVNWTQQTNIEFTSDTKIASSADGLELAAVASDQVYFSTNAGVIWTKASLPLLSWASVAESADGTKLVVVASPGSGLPGTKPAIYTSTDSGANWSNNVPNFWYWTCAAMSADGNEIIAGVGGSTGLGTGGGILVSPTTPVPMLSLAPAGAGGNLALSWLIPSTDFTLQQSTDLVNWLDVTNLPALNLTNLQNQVALPLSDGNGFFRLIH